jgi:aspartate aminotransferase-like enzyme
MKDSLLMLPGPTPVRPEVLAANARPMINHRGPAFAEILGRVLSGLKEVFRTQGEVGLLTCSGTGAMEAALINVLSPGDRVLCCSSGWFGDRFGDIAAAYGARVEVMKVEWGQPFEAATLEGRLAEDREHSIRAVLLTHNETSTGVQNDLRALAAARGGHPALFIVDAVSSLGAAELRMDDWGLDVVAAASQKAFAAPPGLAFVALSRRALQALEQARMPRYYLDLRRSLEYQAKGQTPFTPCVSAVFALDVALRHLLGEGLETAWARHERHARAVRAGVEALGLRLFAAPQAASPTVTAFHVPSDIGAANLQKRLETDYGVVIAGGMRHTAGRILRIGHLGAGSSVLPILGTLSSLECCLRDLGHPCPPGAAAQAADRHLREGEAGVVPGG